MDDRDVLCQLERLVEMNNSGLLTNEQFEAAKNELLRIDPPNHPSQDTSAPSEASETAETADLEQLPRQESVAPPVAKPTPVLSDETGHLTLTQSGAGSGSDGDDREIGYRMNGFDKRRVDEMLDELDELGIRFTKEDDWIYVPKNVEPEVDQLVEALTGSAPEESRVETLFVTEPRKPKSGNYGWAATSARWPIWLGLASVVIVAAGGGLLFDAVASGLINYVVALFVQAAGRSWKNRRAARLS